MIVKSGLEKTIWKFLVGNYFPVLHKILEITKGNRILKYGCRTFDDSWGFQIFLFGPLHEIMKIKVV